MRPFLCILFSFVVFGLYAEDNDSKTTQWQLKKITLKSGAVMRGLISEQDGKVYIDDGSGPMDFSSVVEIGELTDSEKTVLQAEIAKRREFAVRRIAKQLAERASQKTVANSLPERSIPEKTVKTKIEKDDKPTTKSIRIIARRMMGETGHESIEKLKWVDEKGHQGISSEEPIIQFIDGGGQVYVRDGKGTISVQIVHGKTKLFLRTHKDDRTSDNLLFLPEF